MSNTVTTALCLTLPDHTHDYINSFRSKHDKAYPRWMPHINIVYPFVQEEMFLQIKEKLVSEINNNKFKQFYLHLDTIDDFKQSDCITLHAKPRYSQELQNLYSLITNTLNIKDDKEFVPHMTLGQFSKSDMNLVTDIKNSWGSGICFLVDSISMISRNNSVNFKIVENICLLTID